MLSTLAAAASEQLPSWWAPRMKTVMEVALSTGDGEERKKEEEEEESRCHVDDGKP
jgi:hypothetical protein